MTVADRIIRHREEYGLSQQELAQKLGVSLQCVCDWENGIVRPDVVQTVAMAQIFNVSADYLLLGDNPNPIKASLEDLNFEEIFAEEKDLQAMIKKEPEKPKAEEKQATKPRKQKKQKQKKVIKEEPTRKAKIRALAAVLTACIILVALIPLPTGGYKRLWAKFNEDPVQYPYVLVHGLAGWGESDGINSITNYWGTLSGNIPDYLRGEGIRVYEASVGPFSSAWDRACELYAQLTGTTVDYGAAHSTAHGHDRYGKKYSAPLYPDWGKETEGGQIQKINLVGHSFGGTTIRLMTSLLEYGCEEEIQASPDDVSELFKGGKGEYVNSITSLASPHNGSSLYYLVDQESIIPSLLTLAQTVSGVTSIVAEDVINLQLEHFGIYSTDENLMSILNDSYIHGKDNAAYDLSPHGAKELNEKIQTVESVYYFSYSYCTTEKSAETGYHVPKISTLVVIRPFAKLIGSYINVDDSAPVKIDESWLPNDGMVNVISALHPGGEAFINYTQDMEIERGIWHVFPTMTGDHTTVIGGSGNTTQIRKFYKELAEMINSLPRT